MRVSGEMNYAIGPQMNILSIVTGHVESFRSRLSHLDDFLSNIMSEPLSRNKIHIPFRGDRNRPIIPLRYAVEFLYRSRTANKKLDFPEISMATIRRKNRSFRQKCDLDVNHLTFRNIGRIVIYS